MPSGHTIWLRTHNPDGSLKASAPAAGGKGGHTVWLRTHNPDGSLIGSTPVTQGTPIASNESSSGGALTTGDDSTPSTGKSGKTLAARAQQEWVNSIVHYAILFGLALGAYVVVKHVVFGKKSKFGKHPKGQ